MYAILAVGLLAGLSLAEAATPLPQAPVSVPGAPGTATPSPYPQITPSNPPKAGDGAPGGPMLPPIPHPGPPKDQPLPKPAQTPPVSVPVRR
ncbi:hypothetical protein [Pseudomonas sp.]|uniref:hypothetical protein n=1 Tax=Pseudomonas sp. TaxID=306 RepID=UPI0028AEE091|nr:hypothetical protein [Pseudomonas sp.]